ncbi:MAG: hypothetical protein K0S08_928 [Gammaproteobacteria bacterium]|jgi:outer membrane immunogenic protein|nr:hypothetical protein [Gammaproteobacteria bacterium]
MFKKIFAAATILATSSSSFASGFYLGAGMGADSFDNKATINDATAQFNNTGVLGSLFAGYQYNFTNGFNLGAEAFANTTTAKIINHAYIPPATSEAHYNYGLRVLPGYNITPYIEAHLISGFVRGNFQDQFGEFATKKTFNINGFQVGLGTSAMATKNIAIRGDVIYSGYHSHTVTDAFDNVFQNKIHTVDAILSAMYKFG